MDISGITEGFILYLWQTRQFDVQNLHTTQGQKVDILKWGFPNSNAGPDICQASVRVDGIIWHGSIEFHIKSSHWDLHAHNDNDRYDNVILHVVWQNDRDIHNAQGERIPCIELHNRASERLRARHEELQHRKPQFIPCENLLHKVPDVHLHLAIESTLLQKLEEKYNAILGLYESSSRDLEQTLFVYLARYFGLPANQDLFQQLALQTPFKILRKNADNLWRLESLLFGQANMLHNSNGDYSAALYKEYEFLREKYHLSPMAKNVWKYSRMRPHSFPSIRLAQLAAIIHKEHNLIQFLMDETDVDELSRVFRTAASTYWDTHYTFDQNKISRTQRKKLGEQFVDLLLINAVIPMKYFYAKFRADPDDVQHRWVDMYRNLKPETNNVIKHWESIGLSCESSYESQALLYLKKNYCDNRYCAQCRIGHQILKS